MNTQQLSDSVKIPLEELSEVLRALGFDPAQQLPETMNGHPTETYIRLLKRTAFEDKEKRSLLEIATTIKQSMDELNKQKAAGSSNNTNAASGNNFNGVDGLRYLEDYFCAVTKGKCTAEEARANPYTVWGLLWMTFEGTTLNAAQQIANLSIAATADLTREFIFKGCAGQQISSDGTSLRERISAGTVQQGNFFDLSGTALPGTPTNQLQITPGKE